MARGYHYSGGQPEFHTLRENPMNLSQKLAVAGLLAASLVACKRDAPAEAASDPAAAVEQLAQALRDNDLVRFNQLSLPEDLHQQTRQRWDEQRESAPPASAEDEAQFRETMDRLTAPDAEAKLYADLEPMLDRYDAEYAAQLPLAVAMGSAFANQAIQANETMSADQKQHATDVLGAVAGWVGTAPLGDRERAREAIAVVTGTARGLDLESMDAFRRLEQDDMLTRAGAAWGGVKDVMAVYGLDADAALGSVDAETLAETGDSAQVRVNYQLLGSTLGFEMAMERIDGSWYSSDLLANAREELATPVDYEEPDEVLDEPEEYEDEEIIEEDDLGDQD